MPAPACEKTFPARIFQHHFNFSLNIVFQRSHLQPNPVLVNSRQVRPNLRMTTTTGQSSPVQKMPPVIRQLLPRSVISPRRVVEILFLLRLLNQKLTNCGNYYLCLYSYFVNIGGIIIRDSTKETFLYVYNLSFGRF